MIKKEKWIVDNDDELRLFYGDENFNGSAYPCDDIVFMKMIADKLNKLEDENKQLKQDRKRLIGYLWKYKSMDMEEIEEYILSRELLDEYGEVIMMKGDAE